MSFCKSPPFNPWLQTHLYYPYYLCCPLLILPSISTTLTLVVTEVGLVATSIQTATATTTNIGLIFMAFIPLLPLTGSKATSSRTGVPLILNNGLLTGLLSITSSVSFVSPSATQPFNMPSFAAVDNNHLPIFAVGNISATTWFLDTRANQHVTPNLATLTNSIPSLGNDHLHVGDDKGLFISHIRHTMLHSPKHTFKLSNVLHVPHVTKPLLSV